jgi:hypothetical protein
LIDDRQRRAEQDIGIEVAPRAGLHVEDRDVGLPDLFSLAQSRASMTTH